MTKLEECETALRSFLLERYGIGLTGDDLGASRAVLLALRSPTMEMKLAGAPKITAQMPRGGVQADYDAAHDSWIAMIDAALGDGDD